MLHVASDVPIVPPVSVKLNPSENVYVPSVVLEKDIILIEILMMMVNTDLSSRPTQKSTAFVFRVVSKVKIASDLGAASLTSDSHCSTVNMVSILKVDVSFWRNFLADWILNFPLHSIFREARTRITCCGVINNGRLHPVAKTLCNYSN